MGKVTFKFQNFESPLASNFQIYFSNSSLGTSSISHNFGIMAHWTWQILQNFFISTQNIIQNSKLNDQIMLSDQKVSLEVQHIIQETGDFKKSIKAELDSLCQCLQHSSSASRNMVIVSSQATSSFNIPTSSTIFTSSSSTPVPNISSTSQPDL